MPTPTKSPILDFLTSEENTAPVLQVLRYGSEIREEIARRFWSKFEESLKQAQPGELPVQLSWQLDLGGKKTTELLAGLEGYDYFGLEALFPGSRAGEAQGVRYRVELSGGWFGVGLAWLKWEANNFETLCRVKPVKVLQAELKEKRSAYFSEGPNERWLWWELWQEKVYDDPWSWFATDVDASWYAEKTKKFWDLVSRTYILAIEANKALARL